MGFDRFFGTILAEILEWYNSMVYQGSSAGFGQFDNKVLDWFLCRF